MMSKLSVTVDAPPTVHVVGGMTGIVCGIATLVIGTLAGMISPIVVLPTIFTADKVVPAGRGLPFASAGVICSENGWHEVAVSICGTCGTG